MTEEETPENTQKPLRAEKLFLAISLFATLFLMLISSAWTQSSLFLTFLGFLPLLVIIVLLLFIVEGAYKDFVYWATPIFVSLIFLAILGLINPFIGGQLDVGGLAVINILLGLLVVLGLTILEGRKIVPEAEESFSEEKLGAYIHSIEDKCKALNFAIGRVYRASNGGTNALRGRLRIESEWYNEFHSMTEDAENKDAALAALHKIHDRLALMLKKEKEVMSEQEVKGLKHLARSKEGEDRIIDVLIKNDRDPIEQYYVGAVEEVRKILGALEG